MANPDHVEILRQGVDRWNRWREEHRGIVPDLQEAELAGANLAWAELTEAILQGAILEGADLSGADLNGANLMETDLEGANLGKASLFRTDLVEADLLGANLDSALLIWTNFERANLACTQLAGAWVSAAIFANTDLASVRGLDQCHYQGPSTVDHRTLAKNPDLPESFLRGCGLSDLEIKGARLLYGDLNDDEIRGLSGEIVHLRTGQAKVISYHSCFISYSSRNDAFARKLYADLQDKGVRCWFAPEDLKIGDRIRTALDTAISLQEKLLLILSKDSIGSSWVEQEVEKAFERERREEITMLFPIRLDDTVFQVEAGWASYLKNTRHVGDFSSWQDQAEYQRAFDRLLRDLKAS